MGCGASKTDAQDSSTIQDRFRGMRRMSQMNIGMGYFNQTKVSKWMLKEHPELMLLPWEYQRAMGLVYNLNPMLYKCTFISHQWEMPAHPFFDLRIIDPHVVGIIDHDKRCSFAYSGL